MIVGAYLTIALGPGQVFTFEQIHVKQNFEINVCTFPHSLCLEVATFSQALGVLKVDHQRCGPDSKLAADSVSEFEEWHHNALAYTLKLTLILTPSAYSPPKHSI